MNASTDCSVNGWMERYINVQMYECMDGYIAGLIDDILINNIAGGMDRMDGCKDDDKIVE